VTWSHAIEPHEASVAEMPAALAPGVVRALHLRGIRELYSHQARAFDLASRGKHVVVATPTASGKSLCYNLPILQSLASDPSATALYLFPTKALSRDQEEALRGLMRDADLSVGAITYDGDTPNDARRAARQRAGVLLTNPDMLHAGTCRTTPGGRGSFRT
jgi:DEAD/DEAH box helicase domain-containing protein